MEQDTRVGKSHLYTMRELNQHTADVIKKINESGEPAVITRHGRFVALITPLVGAGIESAVLGAVVDRLEKAQTEKSYSSSELARKLRDDEVNVESQGSRRELFQPGARQSEGLRTVTVVDSAGGEIKIDANGLPEDSIAYVSEQARTLTTPEILALVNRLKRG